MGQATRTTKLLLDLGERRQGGANTGKRAALDTTVEVLNEARAFYLDFLLAHELLSWAEACTVETTAHPHALPGWNFSDRFPQMPFA